MALTKVRARAERVRFLLPWVMVAWSVGCAEAQRNQQPNPQDIPDIVRAAVAEARKYKLTNAAVSSTSEGRTGASLAAVLETDSLVVLKPSRVHALLTTHVRFTTWSAFKVVDEIGSQSVRIANCGEAAPTALRLARDEVAFGATGGRSVVDGLPVVWHSPEYDIPWNPNQLYLAMVVRCPAQTITLMTTDSFLLVDGAGKVSDPTWHEGSPPTGSRQELLALGTLQRIALRVLEIEKASESKR